MADETDRPPIDPDAPDAWDARPADEETYPEPDPGAGDRGFTGDEDEGATEGQPPPGAR